MFGLCVHAQTGNLPACEHRPTLLPVTLVLMFDPLPEIPYFPAVDTPADRQADAIAARADIPGGVAATTWQRFGHATRGGPAASHGLPVGDLTVMRWVSTTPGNVLDGKAPTARGAAMGLDK